MSHWLLNMTSLQFPCICHFPGKVVEPDLGVAVHDRLHQAEDVVRRECGLQLVKNLTSLSRPDRFEHLKAKHCPTTLASALPRIVSCGYKSHTLIEGKECDPQ